MRLRPALLTPACLAAVACGGVAHAGPRSVSVDVPCVDAGCSTYVTPLPPAPGPCPGQDQVPSTATLSAARDATLCLVNRERTQRGLGALKPVGPLASVAAAYARRMAREDFFDHTAPNGATFLARIQGTTYLSGVMRSWSVGENLAWGTGRLATPGAIVAAWMKSPGHRRNILTRRFTESGLGVAVGAPRSGVADGDAATYVNEFGARHR